MKHIASTVHAVGTDMNEYTLLVLIDFSDIRLEQLKKLRALIMDIDKKVFDLRHSFAYLKLWTSDATWLHVHDLEDEATEKIFEAASSSEYGFVEIPKDVYDGRMRAHDVSDGEYAGKQLCTELDFIELDDRGIFFTCAEDNSPAYFESQIISWWQLFDEPKPEASCDQTQT